MISIYNTTDLVVCISAKHLSNNSIDILSISKSRSELRVPSNFWFVNICRITLSTSCRFRKVRRMSNNSYQLLVDFEKVRRNFKFRRIFGSYRLLSQFRKVRQNFVDFEKYDRTSTFHRTKLQSSVEFLVRKTSVE